MSRFTEAEYGKMMQDLITRLHRQTIVGSARRSYDTKDYSNLIDLVSAARVAIEYIEMREFGPHPEPKPRVCAAGVCDPEDMFMCSHLSPESQAEMVKILDEWEDRVTEEKADGLHTCPFCGEDQGGTNGAMHIEKFHPGMRFGGPRVWSTVWHGTRDI